MEHNYNEQIETSLKEIEGIVIAAETEKRNLTDAEKTTIASKRSEIKEVKEKLKATSFVSDEKMDAVQRAFNKKDQNRKDYSIGRAIKLAIQGKQLDGVEAEIEAEAEAILKAKGMTRQHPNSILIPGYMVEQRATNTVSSQSALIKNVLLDQISMVQYPIIYPKVATVWNDVGNGNFQIPSLQNIIAGYNTTDSTSTDIALTSAVKTLAPKWMSATAAFTKDFLASATNTMLEQSYGFMVYATDRATDKQMFYDLTGATTAQVYNTGSTGTYQGVLKLVNGIPYATAFISSKRGQTFLQTTPTISGSSTNALPIWSSSPAQVAGVPAYSSFDSPNGLYATGDFSQYHVVFWGGQNVYEMLVDPFTEARKGNIIVQCSRVQNQGIGNLQAFAVATAGRFV